MNAEEAFESFVRDGYAVFRGVYTPTLMQRWRDAYGPLCEAADHVEDALLVVDDDQERFLRVHAYSLETPRSAPRSADNS